MRLCRGFGMSFGRVVRPQTHFVFSTRGFGIWDEIKKNVDKDEKLAAFRAKVEQVCDEDFFFFFFFSSKKTQQEAQEDREDPSYHKFPSAYAMYLDYLEKVYWARKLIVKDYKFLKILQDPAFRARRDAAKFNATYYKELQATRAKEKVL
jgi:hypothetical protein